MNNGVKLLIDDMIESATKAVTSLRDCLSEFDYGFLEVNPEEISIQEAWDKWRFMTEEAVDVDSVMDTQAAVFDAYLNAAVHLGVLDAKDRKKIDTVYESLGDYVLKDCSYGVWLNTLHTALEEFMEATDAGSD